MQILQNMELCCGCHACFNACPFQAIEMKYDEKGFLFPNILVDKCVGCKRCKEVCPVLNNPPIKGVEEIFGCYAKSSEERMSSCSGGFFAVVAREVLISGGVVFGAAYDDNNLVEHIIVDNLDSLNKIKGTKYVQSKIGETYKVVKGKLEKGVLVLFSGTPCQVAGLKRFLKAEYKNLICIDLVCHGVPSPKVWEKYLMDFSKDREVEKVVFRDKKNGSSNATIEYYLKDGKVDHEKYSSSLYIKGFVRNLYIRPSCTKCSFKGFKRCSDITIGDFWSAKEYHPDFGDDYGLSTVIIHSKKGREWFEKVSDKLYIVKSNKQEASTWNECIVNSTGYNKDSESFFARYQNENILELIEELSSNNNTVVKETSKLEKIIRRIFKK